MRILSFGKVPQNNPVRFECVKCKTVFETTQTEARFVPDQRDGNFWQHGCPVCNHLCTAAAQ